MTEEKIKELVTLFFPIRHQVPEARPAIRQALRERRLTKQR